VLEQARIGVLGDRAVAERDGIAEHEDAKRVRRFLEAKLAIVADAEAVGAHRHAGEPARKIRREAHAANRVRHEQPRHRAARVGRAAARRPPYRRQHISTGVPSRAPESSPRHIPLRTAPTPATPTPTPATRPFGLPSVVSPTPPWAS